MIRASNDDLNSKQRREDSGSHVNRDVNRDVNFGGQTTQTAQTTQTCRVGDFLNKFADRMVG